MSIGDNWEKIEYKGKDAKKFEFLIKLLTPPAWFSFSEDHKECRARFFNYGWYSAEKELATVLSYLNVGDSISATVEFDLTIGDDDLIITFTKEKDGKVSIVRNKDYSEFSYDGHVIHYYIKNQTDEENYDFSMEQYIRRVATLVGDNPDYLDTAYEILVDNVIFFKTKCSKASFKDFLQKKRCEPREIEEEELFYDYFATPLNPLVYKMPFTLLDRLGGVFEFNRELVKKKSQANFDLFEEAVESLANGKPGNNGIHGELTERIRNGKDHYPDIPEDIKSLPLNVLYELGGPHKVSRYIDRFGRDHFIKQAKKYFGDGYGVEQKVKKLLYPISLSELLNKESEKGYLEEEYVDESVSSTFRHP